MKACAEPGCVTTASPASARFLGMGGNAPVVCERRQLRRTSDVRRRMRACGLRRARGPGMAVCVCVDFVHNPPVSCVLLELGLLFANLETGTV